MRKRHLRHAVGAVSRNICHDDATPVRRLRINDIVTCGKHAYIFHIRKLRNDIRIEHSLVRQHYVSVANMCDHLFGSSARIYRYLPDFLKWFP